MTNQQPEAWLIERSGMDLLLLGKMLLASNCSCTKIVEKPNNSNNFYFELTHLCSKVKMTLS